MKKSPFYHPASPWFFHLVVLLFYVLVFLSVISFSELLPYIFAPFIFNVVYPFLALAMAIFIRKAYINIYKASIIEEFVYKLTFYNRLLISIFYIFFPSLTLFSGVDYPHWVALLILKATGPLFLFNIFILPIFIRLTLLKKKTRSMTLAIIIWVFFFLFFVNLFIIWRL